MKRLFKTLVFTFICITSLFVCLNVSADTIKTVEVGESSYYQGDLVETNSLEGNLLHNKYIGYSYSKLTGFSAAGSGGGGDNVSGQYYPQSVNVLEIPKDTPAKVVNWTYQVNYGWSLATVEQIAKNFEQHNPGWKVIAAINADFFDINSTKALPLTTSGVFESNGHVYKTASSSSTAVGFTNNGTTNTLIGNKPIEVTDYYTLRLFDKDNKLVAEYKVDNVNPESVQTGLTLYYSYPVFELDEEGKKTGNRISVSSVLPKDALICNFPANCIPMDETGFFGKGSLELSTEELTLNKERFGIYTTDETIKQAVLNASYVTIQRDIIGAYSEADNIVGCGVPLVLDGQGVVYNNKERHPRTMIGVKEDGTLLFVTVDGRQPADEMYGMTYDEQGALMEYYGAFEAYNLDGGGSTTMLIRDGNEFRVLNSPSDSGGARRDSNAILVVIPDVSLKVSKVNDKSVELELPNLPSNISYKDYTATIDGKSYPITKNTTIDGLNSNTEYTINYSYTVIYDGNERQVTGVPIKIKTGNIIPDVSNFTYIIEEGKLYINYEISDPDNVISFIVLYIGSKSYDIKKDTKQLVVKVPDNFKPENVSIVMAYELNSSTNATVTKTVDNLKEFVEESVDEGGCTSGAYFISTILLLSLCGTILIKRK